MLCMLCSMSLTIGTIVHYRLPPRYAGGPPRWRPAIVVDVFGLSLANLTVFVDGLNDGLDAEDVQRLRAAGLPFGQGSRPHAFSVGSSEEGDLVGCWRRRSVGTGEPGRVYEDSGAVAPSG